jgi:hypothetical protein
MDRTKQTPFISICQEKKLPQLMSFDKKNNEDIIPPPENW